MSDRDIAIQERKSKKQQNKDGDPIECTSKVLCMILPEKTDNVDYAYIGESGFIAKKVNLSRHTRGIEDLTFDEKETFLFSASSDGLIIKWNPLSGECLQIFEGHLTSVYALKVFDEEMWTEQTVQEEKSSSMLTEDEERELEELMEAEDIL
ncbi:6781_t:CDS:2 [Racocetra fulgida]|uniref:6781_t:CDS:1 n=1 Tax=Racocetra fulgida TaxID=60492 RepID=A0A9N9BPN4_9GLOM|nr:6781_t:CDS:2 [Racocetra fulgida]